MFMNYQKFAGYLGHNFVGKWFIAKKNNVRQFTNLLMGM